MKKRVFSIAILFSFNILSANLDSDGWKNIIANTVNNNFGTKLKANFVEQKKVDNQDIQLPKINMTSKAAFRPEEMDFKNWGKDSSGRKEKWSQSARINFEIIISKVIEAINNSGSKDLPKYAQQLPELNNILFDQVIPAYMVVRKNLDFARKQSGNQNYFLPANSAEMKSLNMALNGFNEKLNLLSQGITKVDTYQAGPKAAQEILRYLVGGPAKKANIAKSFEKETGVYFLIVEKVFKDVAFDKSLQNTDSQITKEQTSNQKSSSSTYAAREAELKEIKSKLETAAKEAYLNRSLKDSNISQESAAKFAQWNNALKAAQDFIEHNPNPNFDKLITNFKSISTKARKLLDELKSRQDLMREEANPVAAILDSTIRNFNKEVYPVILESTKISDQLISLDSDSVELLKFILGQKTEIKDNNLIQAQEGLLVKIWKKIVSTFSVF